MIEQHSIGSKGHTVLTPDLGVKWPVLARVPTGMRYKVDWWSGRGQDLSDTCGGFARTQTGRGARRLWSGERPFGGNTQKISVFMLSWFSQRFGYVMPFLV